MELKDKIIQVLPKDHNSGNRSSNRFDFQKNWAIKKIIELHESEADYLVTFEYYDDIIVFNSSEAPSQIAFYQVKTLKDKPWRIPKLITPDKTKSGKGNSIIGKLCFHLQDFGDEVNSLNFITNSSLQVELSQDFKNQDSTEFNRISYDMFAPSIKEQIYIQLKKEFPDFELPALNNLLFFKLGELNINSQETDIKGVLAEFIERYIPDTEYRITPIYNTIFDEIKRKSDFEYQPADFEQIKKEKSISKSDFESFFVPIKEKNLVTKRCEQIESFLLHKDVSMSDIKNIRSKWSQYMIDKMNYNNDSLIKLENEISKIIAQHTIKNIWSDSFDILEKIKEVEISNLYDDSYIQAIILLKEYGD